VNPASNTGSAGPGEARRHRFSKSQRLRRRAEFKRVFEVGHRSRGKYLTLLVAPNKIDHWRLGIVASKQLGDAVRRNRAKRLIREVFRRTPPLSEQLGVDIVVIPRRELFDATYPNIEQDYRTLFRRSADRLLRRG
jgi:ribonuclease P protein component